MKHTLCIIVTLLATCVGRVHAESFSLTADQREKCLHVLRTGLHADDFWPAIHAAEALTLAGLGDEVRRFLLPKVPLEQDDQKLCGLSRELVRAGDEGKATIMFEILEKEDTYGHTHAAESMFKVNQTGNRSGLERAMKSTDMKLRLMAAAALARPGDQQARDLLRRELKSDDEQTFRIAAWILARIGDQTDIPQLRKNVARAQDPVVKCYNEHALAALGDEEGLKALRNNLDNEDPVIRTYAATFAGDALNYAIHHELAARQSYIETQIAPRLLELLEDEHFDARIRAAQTLLVMDRAAL